MNKKRVERQRAQGQPQPASAKWPRPRLTPVSGDECNGLAEHIGQGGILRGGFGGWGDGGERGNSAQTRLDHGH